MPVSVTKLFEKIKTHLATITPENRKLNHVYKWNIVDNNDGPKTYMLDLKQYKIYAGDDNAECTLTCTMETLDDLATGKLEPKTAVEKGTLKVDGELSYAIELIPFVKLVVN